MNLLKTEYENVIKDIIKKIESEHDVRHVGSSVVEQERIAHFLFNDNSGSLDFDFSYIKEGDYPEYDKVLIRIIERFKGRMSFEFFEWIEYGYIADFRSYIFNMNDIIFFVFNHIPLAMLTIWYDLRYSGQIQTNFSAFCKLKGYGLKKTKKKKTKRINKRSRCGVLRGLRVS